MELRVPAVFLVRQVVPNQKALYKMHSLIVVYSIQGSHPGFCVCSLVMCHGALNWSKSPAECLECGVDYRFLHRKLCKSQE